MKIQENDQEAIEKGISFLYNMAFIPESHVHDIYYHVVVPFLKGMYINYYN